MTAISAIADLISDFQSNRLSENNQAASYQLLSIINFLFLYTLSLLICSMEDV